MRTASSLVSILVLAAAPGALAQQAVNPIHPQFTPLDAEGRPARPGGAVSADATCGACHDAKYIAAHTAHGAGQAEATCIQCHVDGGRLEVGPATVGADGRLKREAVRIGAPRSESCARCHGFIAGPTEAVALPDTLEAAPAAGRTYSLTLGEGAIFAPQRMRDSFLNLAGKSELAAPWDVHAAKLVECAACHYSRNNPEHTDNKQATLRYVENDPRRQSVAEFLQRPDHRLAETDCRSCHDPMAAHRFLPYRARHMEVLACQSCHVAAPMGAAAEMIDESVATAGGKPVIRYRNVERRPGEPLNAATITPLTPLLVVRTGPDGVQRLAPVNLVSRWRWRSRADGTEVPFERVKQAMLDGDHYAVPVLAAFDANDDGKLDDGELRLDSKAKTDLVASRLTALGVSMPYLEGTIEPHPLAHGVSSRERAVRECSACHATESLLSGTYPIAPFLPGGVAPVPLERGRVDLAGSIAPTAQGGLAFVRDDETTPGGLHVLGHSRQARTNLLGFAIFVAVFLGVSIHGLARLVLRRRNGATARPPEGPREYVFGRYERIWHWTMAFTGIGLILTGVQIHNAGWSGWPLSLPAAVELHNVLAGVLLVNGFLALFYHLATAAIRNFIPHPHGLVARVLEHLEYQARGIFYGEAHPPHPAGHKLNPLQQMTYLALLNVLFPLQIGTGALVWAIGHWPHLGDPIGGLQFVAPLHNLGAWLFLSFFVLHVYLVTTGRTVSDHLRSMVTGYQAVDPDPAVAQGE